MRLIHSSLSLLYLLLAVLLPWLHMPMHGAAHQHEQKPEHACCQHHTEPATESPESEEAPHDHHHCSLCDLTLVPVILPELSVLIQNTGIVLCEPEPILLPVEEVHIHPHQARAPPFQLI